MLCHAYFAVVCPPAAAGFIHLAIGSGASIVPSYCFGEVDTFHTSDLFQTWRLALSKWFRIAIPFVYGDGEWYRFPVSIKVPLTIVVGEPIPTVQTERPTHEQVNEVHAKYVQALRTIYEEHKARLGYGDRTLLVYGNGEKPAQAAKL